MNSLDMKMCKFMGGIVTIPFALFGFVLSHSLLVAIASGYVGGYGVYILWVKCIKE